jgi:hypothetical protein
LFGPAGPDPGARAGCVPRRGSATSHPRRGRPPARVVQVQADDVLDLGRQLWVGGELEGRYPPGLHTILTPHSGDGVAAHAELAGQQPGRPVRDASLAGGGLRVTWRISIRRTRRRVRGRPGRGQSGSPSRPRRRYRRRQAMTVGRDTNPLGDLGIGGAVGGQQQDPGSLGQHGRQLAGPSPSAELGQVGRREGKRSGGRHTAWSHIPPHRQTTSATQH